ncbi:uncharacterized protein [Nicotiana sylvestris]|uniref:uncharacterized protein n=1 Tax=Nicotiana sylvestris TaxID=4096 RepID=UPI00388CBD48
MGKKKSLKKKMKMMASPNSLKLAGKLVKYNPNFISNDDDDFEDLPEFGCDLGYATHKSVEAMQNTPSEGKQNTHVDRRTRSHSGTLSDRVTRSHTAQHVVVEKGTSSKRKIKIAKKDVVKDKGKGSKRKAKNDGDDVPSKKRKVHVNQKCSSSSDLKLWDYYVPLDDHYSTRISVHTNCSIVEHLKNNLDDQQIEMFRRTCFGYFVDLPNFFIQNQLIHSLFLREVVSPKDNELWIKVNSTKLRFGLAEFCIIIGLKCNGDPNKDYESVQSSRLMELYFPSMSKVSKKSLTDCFLNKMWKSDEDALKIAVLYVIHSFLFSTTNDDLITKNDFMLVESGDFETFPWGKVVFNAMLCSMKDKVHSRREMYRYGGFPLAFQCWFYECCPYTRKNLACRIGNLMPRILNWKVKKKVTFKRLRKEFFLLSQEQLVFGNIFPTNDEQTRLQLDDFVPVCEDKNEIHIESGVVAEVKTNAKKHSKNKPESQSINNENPNPQSSNLNSSEKELKLMRSEIKKVNDKVSSLKNLMISSFKKVFKALGVRNASKGNQKNDNHHDKEFSENNFGSEEVMEKNIGIEKVVKKNVDNEVSLEQTVDVMEGVVKDSIQHGKSSEGVGDDEAWIEDAEPEITAITNSFVTKILLIWGVWWMILYNLEDHIVVVDHDTPEMNPRERKPVGVMKSPFINTFDSGGTIQVVENKLTKSKKLILTIKYPFEGNVDNLVDFKHIDEFLEKNRDMNLITETDPIVEYILGYFLRCNVPWSTVDEIIFPINLSDKWHWILARLSFIDLHIYVYDSMSGARQNSAVRRSVESYSVLLPYFLHRIGFWDTKENPMGIPANDPFEIHVVDGLPTQDNTCYLVCSDCGVYVAAFAEYIIQGSNIPKAIDIDGIRNRYGILLWDYGVKKQRGYATSDDESTGRLKD